MAAFEAGLAAGADELELDVRVTKDGVCVLSHDAYLAGDTAGGPGQLRAKIAACTMEELRAIRPDICTLAEAALFVHRRAPLVVEVKPGTPPEPVIAAVEDLFSKGWQPADFLLASFNARLLRRLHTALPKIPCVVNERYSGVRAVRRARQVGTKRLVFPHWNVWPGFIRALARRGYKLTVYTVNNPAQAAHLAKYGAWGVVTDRPDLFKLRKKPS